MQILRSIQAKGTDTPQKCCNSQVVDPFENMPPWLSACTGRAHNWFLDDIILGSSGVVQIQIGMMTGAEENDAQSNRGRHNNAVQLRGR